MKARVKDVELLQESSLNGYTDYFVSEIGEPGDIIGIKEHPSREGWFAENRWGFFSIHPDWIELLADEETNEMIKRMRARLLVGESVSGLPVEEFKKGDIVEVVSHGNGNYSSIDGRWGFKLEWLEFLPDEETNEMISHFIKSDTAKISGYHLIPTIALDEMAKVLDYGAKKYSPDNWKNCDDVARYKDALWRHMLAWQNGEDVDSESGLSHLAHMITNVAFLIWFEENKKKRC